jgi:copper chaperone
MKEVIYQVPGISCGHCVKTIESELGEREGIIKVKADVESKSVKIDFQDPASESQIKTLLKEINYPVLES